VKRKKAEGRKPESETRRKKFPGLLKKAISEGSANEAKEKISQSLKKSQKGVLQ